jgi:hypothetical protein
MLCSLCFLDLYLYLRLKKVLLIVIVLFCNLLHSQSEPFRNSPYTIRGTISIPNIISSQAYRVSYRGTYDGNISFNRVLFSNFYAGIGYYNALFNRARREEFDKINLKTRQQTHGGFLKLGYDYIYSEKAYCSLALNSGYAYNFYTGVSRSLADTILPATTNKFNSLFLTPEVGVNFLTGPKLCFGITLSYVTMLYKYNPRDSYMDGYLNYKKLSNRSYMSWINIGFSFHVLLGKNNLKSLELS